MTKKQMMERMRDEIFCLMNCWNSFSEIEWDETESDDRRKWAKGYAGEYHREAMLLNELCTEFFGIDAMDEWLDR